MVKILLAINATVLKSDGVISPELTAGVNFHKFSKIPCEYFLSDDTSFHAVTGTGLRRLGSNITHPEIDLAERLRRDIWDHLSLNMIMASHHTEISQGGNNLRSAEIATPVSFKTIPVQGDPLRSNSENQRAGQMLGKMLGDSIFKIPGDRPTILKQGGALQYMIDRTPLDMAATKRGFLFRGQCRMKELDHIGTNPTSNSPPRDTKPFPMKNKGWVTNLSGRVILEIPWKRRQSGLRKPGLNSGDMTDLKGWSNIFPTWTWTLKYHISGNRQRMIRKPKT